MAPAPPAAPRDQVAAAALRRASPLLYTPQKRAVRKELGLLALFIAAVASATLFLHYQLPTPKEATTALRPRPAAPISSGWYDAFFARTLDASGLPMYEPSAGASMEGALPPYFSEGNAMLTIQHLAEDIGYRVVGTQQHIDAEEWVQSILQRYVGTHDTGNGTYETKVELFTQFGDGAHRFDILGHPVWKQYYSMSNLIVRISDGTPESLDDTLLLNAHIDTTLPSPGAADDAAGVAIMMELLRVLTLRGAPRVRHGIILLFNNGEESLQDASHLYMTQHNTTNEHIRAVINMEACGVSGPTLLFQATNPLLIDAYARVPHPFGTVLASDVFSSGLIMSDTDFRQFVEYGNGMPGLDMAVVGSSYLYHTRRDTPAHIERGVLQHFGENVFSLVESLALDAEGHLAKVRPWPYKVKQILPIYFSVAGRYLVVIPAKFFKTLIMALALFSNYFLSAVSGSEQRVQAVNFTLLAAAGILGNILAAVVATNSVAAAMRLMHVPMSWFAHEYYPLLLYTPPALAAIVGVQLAVHHGVERTRAPYLEHSTFLGASLLFTIALLAMNFFGLGSAYMFFVATLSSLVPIVVNDFLLVGFYAIASDHRAIDARVHFGTYFLAVLGASTIGAEGFVSFLDLLVPLMGRMGMDVPVDHIIATLLAALLGLNSVCLVPLGHRYGPAFMRKALAVFVAVTVLMMAFFAYPGVPTFDALHPRRLLVHHIENRTSGEWHLAMGTLDAAPRNPAMASDIQQVLLGPEPNATWSFSDGTASRDMDILFPLTHFIETERLALPTTPARAALSNQVDRWSDFRVTCAGHVDEANATRTILLRLSHPGLAWSTLSFAADVVDWDFPAPPPQGTRRHHLKDVSRLGANEWTMRIVVRMTPEQLEAWRKDPSERQDTLLRTPPHHPPSAWRLAVHFSGLDAGGMYPHHKDTGMDRLAMQDLAALDGMLSASYPEIDAMLMSVVAGVAEC